MNTLFRNSEFAVPKDKMKVTNPAPPQPRPMISKMPFTRPKFETKPFRPNSMFRDIAREIPAPNFVNRMPTLTAGIIKNTPML